MVAFPQIPPTPQRFHIICIASLLVEVATLKEEVLGFRSERYQS
jgi:hypothetical protein